MKNLPFILFTILLLISCNSDSSDSEITLIGDWKLVEVLADPGDGSGTFLPVESNKRITFGTNGILTSNGNLCDMSITTDAPTVGMYSSSEFTFTSFDCENAGYSYAFEQTDNILIITYLCFEPCKAKYIKL